MNPALKFFKTIKKRKTIKISTIDLSGRKQAKQISDKLHNLLNILEVNISWYGPCTEEHNNVVLRYQKYQSNKDFPVLPGWRLDAEIVFIKDCIFIRYTDFMNIEINNKSDIKKLELQLLLTS